LFTDFKIGSLNVRGLGDRLKRREMFDWLRRKKFSIYMLQEVHCSEITIPVWSAEWGYQNFLAAAPVLKEASLFYSTTTLIFNLNEHTWIPTADLLSAISLQIKNV